MKLSITPEKLKAASLPTTRMNVSMDITGLSYEQIAEALFNLAARVEYEADVEKRTEALRASVEAADPTLKTTTRLKLKHPDSFPVDLGDRELGRATVITIQPPKKRKPRKRRVTKPRTVVAPVVEEEEDEAAYAEDDDVEFYRHDAWHEGIILDRTNLYTYLVEDKHGRRWEVNMRGLRKPDEGW